MISVCIPTYNGERFIKDQLLSILNQLNLEDEIIISDDNSTDSTLNVINSLNDKRIKLFINTKKKKSHRFKFYRVTTNIENALQQCSGEYIYLADQDDLWMPDKVEICQKHLKDYDLVLTDCTIIDENNNLLMESYFRWNNSKSGILKNLFFKNAYLGCCIAFKRKVLNEALPISIYIVPHDIWFGLIGEWYGRVFFINKQLVAYRRHTGNVSPSTGKSTNGFLFKIQYRIILLKSLILKILK